MNGILCLKHALVSILAFFLFTAQLSYSQKWIECNESNAGKIIDVGGNQYVCTSNVGTYGWALSSQTETNTLLVLIIFASIALIAILLKRRKLKTKKLKRLTKLD